MTTNDAYFVAYNTKSNQWMVWHSASPVCKTSKFSGVSQYVKEVLYATSIEKGIPLPRIVTIGIDDKDIIGGLENMRNEAQGELERKLQQSQPNHI